MESNIESVVSKSYPLSHFLVKKQFFWLKYMNLPVPWYNKAVSIFCGLVSITFVLRAPFYIFIPLEPLRALYFGDFAYNAQSIHDIIWSVQAGWSTAATYALYVLDTTNRSRRMQAWFTGLSIMEEGKDEFFRKPNDKLIFASNFYYMNGGFAILAGTSFTHFLFVPNMILHCSNIPLLVLLNVHGLIMSVTTYAAMSYGVNLCFLFSYYAFLISQKLTIITERFEPRMNKTRKWHRNIASNSSRLIALLKQVYSSNLFWSKVNSNAFSTTFFAQIFLTYAIFFIKLDKIYRFVLLTFSTINFTCGQSVNFLSGVYARSKFNDCQKQLRRVIYSKDIKLRSVHKMKLMIISEYLTNRKLFVILSSLEMNSYNYLMVFLEMISLLFLVILNKNRNQ